MPKPYNTKSLQDRLNQASPEEGGLGKAGLYRHPGSGEEVHTLSDPLFGEAQSNAFVQLGFERVRDSKPEEIKQVVDFSIASANGQTDSLKGLSARLDQLEGVAEKNKELEAEVARLQKEALENAKSDPAAQSGDDAKAAAEAQLKVRGQLGDEDESDESDDDSEGDEPEDEKPVSKQNETELKATAEAEGVDLSGAETVKAKREAILAAREGKKESEN